MGARPFMNLASAIRHLLLSALWGGSFLLLKIGASGLDPVTLIAARVGLAALFLFAAGSVLGRTLHLRTHWRHYLILGFFNSALPFLLFAVAAGAISASLMSILNATAPIWGAVIGAVWTRTRLTLKAIAGLVLGLGGVAVLTGFDPSTFTPDAMGAIFCALAAAASYGIATTYARTATRAEPFANAHGSMWAATLLLVPLVPFTASAVPVDGSIIGAVVALGILCTGIAYLIYFRLIADIGPAPALTVTFLIPVFGVMWGHVILGEPIGGAMLIGAAMVLVGTALVTGFSPRSFWHSRGIGANSPRSE